MLLFVVGDFAIGIPGTVYGTIPFCVVYRSHALCVGTQLLAVLRSARNSKDSGLNDSAHL